jgi:hypothetical protein
MYRFFPISDTFDNENVTDRIGGVSWLPPIGETPPDKLDGAGGTAEECIEAGTRPPGSETARDKHDRFSAEGNCAFFFRIIALDRSYLIFLNMLLFCVLRVVICVLC